MKIQAKNKMEQKDRERLDRIEHHLKLLKENDTNQMTVMLNIQNALIGSAMNGNKGIVSRIDEIEDIVDELDDFKKEATVYVRQSKFVIGAIVVALVALLAKAYFPDAEVKQKQKVKTELYR